MQIKIVLTVLAFVAMSLTNQVVGMFGNETSFFAYGDAATTEVPAKGLLTPREAPLSYPHAEARQQPKSATDDKSVLPTSKPSEAPSIDPKARMVIRTNQTKLNPLPQTDLQPTNQKMLQSDNRSATITQADDDLNN